MSIDLARALVDGGVRVSVPTTLNVGSVDLLHHPRNWNGTDELADNARTLMGLYTALEQCLKSVDRLGMGRTFPGDRLKVPS